MKVYFHRSLPAELVIEDEAGLWLVRMTPGIGWRERRPYKGHRASLVERPAAEGIILAKSMGWHDRDERLSPGESARVQFRCARAIHVAVLARAEAEGLTERQAWERAGAAWASRPLKP